jgi:antitoxin component YwqK of YwqJK toxin-antitoxin module
MRYKKFIFDTECVLDLKDDLLIFPFQEEYIEYQSWAMNNPNDFNRVVNKFASKAQWQGLLEEVRMVRGNQYQRKLFHPDGTLYVISEVRKLPNQEYQSHGLQTSYYESGNVKSIENFRHGDKAGEYKQYTDDDTKNIIVTGQYDYNCKVGEWEYNNEKTNRPLAKELYKAGVLIERVEVDTKGKSVVEKNYNSNGELHGIYRDSHNNGELRARGIMRNGKMDGMWFFYYIDGRENYKIKFDNGKPLEKFVYYNNDGSVQWSKDIL